MDGADHPARHRPLQGQAGLSRMSKRSNAAERPLPPKPNHIPRAGRGPNKASGHKGGISRQGSKRG